MRPQLRPGVYWLPGDEGAHVVHNGGHLVIPGRSAATLLDRLMPYLDGRSSMDELLEGLPEHKRVAVRSVIAELTGAGCIRDAAADDPHTLSDHELDVYAAEIGHVGCFEGSAARRFQDYRESSVVVCGAGLTLTALVQAALRAGLRHLTVLVTPECPTDLDRIRACAALAAERDPAQHLTLLFQGSQTRWDWDDVPSRALATADAVLHVSDRPMAARARHLDRLCAHHGCLLVQALLLDGRAWIGPASATTGPAWESAWRRAAGARPTPAGTDPFAEPADWVADPALSAATAAAVAHQLHAVCFRWLTGIERAQAATRLIEVDLATLQTASHAVLDHPAHRPVPEEDEDAAGFARRVSTLRDAAPMAREVFVRRAVPLFDPAAGVLLSIGEHDYAELPLRVARVVVSAPAGVEGRRWRGTGDPGSLVDTSAGHPVAIGVGERHAQARLRATIAGLAIYTSLMVDRRRISPEGRLWAFDPLSGVATAVDAAAAFPVLTGAGRPYARPTGLAAALSWAQAAEKALLEHCRALAVAALACASSPFPRVGLDEVPPARPAARYRQMLRIIGLDVEVYDVGGAWGVPVYAFCSGSTTVSYCAATTPGDALAAGFEQVLLWHQATTNNQPDYAPPAVPLMPPSLRGTTMAPANRRRRDSGRPDQPDQPDQPGWPAVAGALARHGYRPLLVPLDHDPVVSSVLPYTMQAVLTHG